MTTTTPTAAETLPAGILGACAQLNVMPTDYILAVNIARQTVSLFKDEEFVAKYSCSTSRFGIGQVEGSNCTPLGLHRIAEKIGAGVAPGTVYKGRVPIGHVSELGLAASKITTRILWLEGLEPGLNRGGNVDSHNRYIYIHGTGDQSSIGRPESHGCIHLADADIVPLFDLLLSGTLVWIAEA